MKLNNNDKILAWSVLLSGLSVSAVAIYYSVAGLVAIFSAAVIPIIVMGVALEVSKLAATVWLKQNWSRAPLFIKSYLLAAITILMLITSMGIFGFLSKAHNDQNLVSGEVLSKISVYDDKIKTEKENIDVARKALKQLDEAVDQVMGRSTDERGADKAAQIRRAQQRERAQLQKDIVTAQSNISRLQSERAPIAAEVRKVEAEVGPIKYIAKLIYDDNPETNTLEKAVTWVIIIIVIVFDPLAVILLLASQYSFTWLRKQQEAEGDSPAGPTGDVVISDTTVTEQPKDDFLPTYEEITPKDPEPKKDTSIKFVEGGEHPADTFEYERETKDEEIVLPEPVPGDTIQDADDTVLASAEDAEQTAMARWKAENPDSSLKLQRQLLEKGIIQELPWAKYLTPKADYTEEQEAAVEAAKWAQEQLDETNRQDISWMEHDDQGNQIKKTKGTYQQNAEQNERTLWQRIQDSKK